MITSDCPLLLGSASPRRSNLLASLGIPFVVLPADIVEDVEDGETPAAYLERITLGKLSAVWARLERPIASEDSLPPVAAALVADTIVVIDDCIVGKPADMNEAMATLGRLVGRVHTVFTRYVIGAARRGTARDAPLLGSRTVSTRVRLRASSADEVAAYAATGEGLDKAGAYAAQGVGAFLVESIEGSYTNVVGLPACELVSDLRRLGLLGAFPAPRVG
jgi:septum formation protein